MEIINNKSKIMEIKSKIQLENFSNLLVSGVDEIVNTSDSNLTITITNKRIIFIGTKIKVNRFDIEQKILEAVGSFTSFKILESKNLLKRIFK